MIVVGAEAGSKVRDGCARTVLETAIEALFYRLVLFRRFGQIFVGIVLVAFLAIANKIEFGDRGGRTGRA